MPGHALFTPEFLLTLRSLIGVHHTLYPRLEMDAYSQRFDLRNISQ